MGFITIWKEVTGLALLLLHLVHATQQPQSKIWKQKKAPFIAHLWWLVLLTLHTHTHTNFSSEEEGFQNPFSQLLGVIDPGLLIPKGSSSLGCAERGRRADPRRCGAAAPGTRSPLLGFMLFFVSLQVFHKNAAMDLAGSNKFSFLCRNQRDFSLPSGTDGALLM